MASILWAGCGELNNVDLKPNITLFCGEGCTNSTDRFQVTRTIGSGLSSDFSAAGEQLSYNVMVGLGVIEAQACVDLEIVSGADADVTASLLVNGRRWSTFSIPRRRSAKFSYPMSVELLRFAVRTGFGTPPRPANNVITAVFTVSGGICNSCGASIKIARIRFNALAPFLFVHGRGAGADWFDGGFKDHIENQRVGFRVLDIRKDNSPSIDDKELMESGIQLEDYLSSMMVEFGVDRVHIVAHSKGGLWSRAFLGKSGEQAGVYSVTTLSTPHRGSVLADIGILTRKITRTSALLQGLGTSKLVSQEVDESLMRKEVGKFNRTNIAALPRLVKIDGRSSRVAYLAFRADANLNKNYSVEGFSIIEQLSEACSKPLDNFCLPVNIVPYALPRPSTEVPINTIGASLSFIMQAVRQVSILEPSGILQFEAQSAPREFNDFAVADSSMLIHPFENAGEPLAAHHNALSSSSTAQLILSRITLEKQKRLEAK